MNHLDWPRLGGIQTHTSPLHSLSLETRGIRGTKRSSDICQGLWVPS